MILKAEIILSQRLYTKPTFAMSCYKFERDVSRNGTLYMYNKIR